MIAEKCFGQEWISAKAMELRYPGDPMAVKDLSINSPDMNRLNKLKKTFPEAFWYWYHTSQLLEQ